jgi:hypothetical protein
VVAIILSTVLLQGRQHAVLAHGFNTGTLRGLVRSNWIRVIAWSAAGVLALWMCHWTFAP